MTASPINSSKRNPCPICGRTKDGDCRQMPNGTVVCHHPKDLKPGDTQTIDGVVWAFTGNSGDGRGGVFKVDEPRQKGHLRVVASGVTASKLPSQTPPVPAAVPSLPEPEDFFLARFTDEAKAVASKREGDFWFYDQHHRQQRQGSGSTKKIFTHHQKPDGHWVRGAGKDICPCWNEGCLAVTGDGTAIYGEGEKVAEALCSAGVLGVSVPGHEAESLEKCTAALARHKDLGVKLVAYVADNDQAGKKKAGAMASAASAAGLPFVGINAGDVWPDLPKGGSIDDLTLSGDEIVATLEQAFRDQLASSAITTDSTPDPLTKETNSKQQTLQRLVDELVMARIDGDTSRDAVLMSQTWQLGIPRDTTDGMVLERWKELHGIGSSNTKIAPVQGRFIGEAIEEHLTQRLPGFVQDNGLALIVADAGVGKTHMALMMAHKLINGGEGFLDQQEGPSSKGNVLYIGTDGGPIAYTMISDYAQNLADRSEWSGLEIWAEEAGKRKAWCLTLYNLELLRVRLEKGDITAVFIDTVNAVFQLAGVNPYTGPVDHYLRLLKDLVCKYCPLIMLHHTNRSGSGMKSIGGHPAYQEVPDAIHRIEHVKEKDQEEEGKRFKWHVEKLRGETRREFSYRSLDGDVQIAEGHYFTNCGDKLLVEIKKKRAAFDSKGFPELGNTTPKSLATAIQEPPSSVRTALSRLRQKGLIEKKGKGFQLTSKGEARVLEIKL